MAYLTVGIEMGGITNTAGAASLVSSGTLYLMGGNNVTLSQSQNSITISGPTLATALSYTESTPLAQAGLILSASSNAGAAVGFGSSMFLRRIFIPAPMNLTEVDLAIALSYATTNSGAGHLSQSFVLYSFSNSSVLAAVTSTSGLSTWTSGSGTPGSAVSLFQTAWQGTFLRPLTFPSPVALTPGEYVVGHQMSFSFLNASWSVSLFGGNAQSLTTSTLADTGGLSVASYLSSVIALATGGSMTAFTMSASSSTAGSSYSTAGVWWTVTNAVAGARASLFGAASNSNIVSGVTLGTATSLLATSGLLSFSMQYTGASTAIPTSVYPDAFFGGILGSNATLGTITLTAQPALTWTGTAALLSPWFCLIGS